jgi:hypothetical protein
VNSGETPLRATVPVKIEKEALDANCSLAWGFSYRSITLSLRVWGQQQ